MTVGFTVILKVTGVPLHDPIDGVTVMAPVMEIVEVFVAVNALIVPVPLAPKPIAVLLLVHEKEVPLLV